MYEKQLFEICKGNGDVSIIGELVNQRGIDVNTVVDKVLLDLCITCYY